MKSPDSKDDVNASMAFNPLQDAIKRMEESLIAWRVSLEASDSSETETHLDRFLVCAREGYRLMALKRSYDPNEADEIAQSCILSLIRRARTGFRPPMLPSKIDSLLDSKPPSAKASSGTPLAGYLHVVLSNGVAAYSRTHRPKASRSTGLSPDTEDGHESADLSARDRLVSRPDDVRRNVSNALNRDLAARIHDDYLDKTTYKGSSLRAVFGDWTPMAEWTGLCSPDDRPSKKIIPLRTLQRHIDNIKELIRGAKILTREMDRETARPPDDTGPKFSEDTSPPVGGHYRRIIKGKDSTNP